MNDFLRATINTIHGIFSMDLNKGNFNGYKKAAVEVVTFMFVVVAVLSTFCTLNV